MPGGADQSFCILRFYELVKMKNKILLVAFAFLFIVSQIYFIQKQTLAAGSDCDNRFITPVNPVRGRNLWTNKSLRPIQDQYSAVSKYNLSATWLLQYDVLLDKELLYEIRKFNDDQEKGVFLEVSQNFAEQSRVIYPHAVPWFSPRAVFLSSYSQSERRKLIDKLFKKFKEEFGFYPKSVGAWWIDSYSLNYMKDKYDIKAAMIVADQKITDNYGVWGQWWGVPYYPSKANILTPASSLKNKLEVTVIQWAQRDPLQAFGEGFEYSNYSLQANDYTERGQDTRYFESLVDVYLDCKNQIGQVTVGLETGMESIRFLDEYKNQLESLKKRKGLNFVTMSEFADQFTYLFPDFPKTFTISYELSVWNLNSQNRSNQLLGDFIFYNQDISFPDYFVSDNASFLDRRLQDRVQQKSTFWFPYFLIFSLGLLILSYQKMLRIWLISMLFSISAFGLILRSFYQYGWKVYFGPQLPILEIFQICLILISFLVIWQINKIIFLRKILLNLWLLPLIFGLDFFVQSLRISDLSGRYYIGFATDALRFVGLSIRPVADIRFVNQDFPSYISAAFLKVNFDHIWENTSVALILYPLVHIVLGIVFGFFLIRFPSKIQKLIVGILIILFLLHLHYITSVDPRLVTPILLQ